MSVTYVQARICEPSPWIVRSRPASDALDERADRAAADLPGAEDVEGVDRDGRQTELIVVGVRHVLAGELRHGVRPARLTDGADRRDVAFLDVQRVCPEHLARREVDEALERGEGRERRLERVVRADDVHAHRRARGSASTVSTPAIAAQWTKWVAPAAASRNESASRMSPCTSVKFGWSPRSVPESASRWRLSYATTCSGRPARARASCR